MSRIPITIADDSHAPDGTRRIGTCGRERLGYTPRVEAATSGANSLFPSSPLTTSNVGPGQRQDPRAGVERQASRGTNLSLGGVFVTYTDQVITCSDCGIDFVFSASEQEFFAEKGFASAPKRCSSCRAQRRASGGGGGGNGYSGGGGYSAGGYSSGPREMHDAVCARCGNETQVPFRPTGARPVYCSDCFRMMRG